MRESTLKTYPKIVFRIDTKQDFSAVISPYPVIALIIQLDHNNPGRLNRAKVKSFPEAQPAKIDARLRLLG
jgi:hypothetical protein